MKKPSRFQQDKPEQIIFKPQHFYKTKLHNRYIFSKKIIRIQKSNLHIGIDIIERKQVIIVSMLINQMNKLSTKNNSIADIMPQLVWEGFFTFSKAKYKFQVYNKKGCMLQQYLRQLNTISSNSINFILSLLLDLVLKIHQINANIRDIDIKSLHLVQKVGQKSLNVEICNFNILYLKKNAQLRARNSLTSRLKQREKYHQYLSPNKKMSFFLQQVNAKPSFQRDIRIIFEKICQLIFEFSANVNQQKIQQIQISIKTVYFKINNLFTESQKSNLCTQKISQIIHRLKFTLNQQKQKAIQIINKIMNNNKKNIQNLIEYFSSQKEIFHQNLQTFQQSDYQIQDINIQDGECHNIEQKVINHVLNIQSIKDKKFNQEYN